MRNTIALVQAGLLEGGAVGRGDLNPPPQKLSHFHGEISLLATEKSLLEERAKEPQASESPPVFAFSGCGLTPNIGISL